MNKVYRLVWNVAQHALVVASEFAKAHVKGRGLGLVGSRVGRQRLLALVLILAPAAAMASLPTGGKVEAGKATIQQTGTTLTIHQATSKAILDWQTFNIGKDNTVNFLQPNSSSVALNRVLGNDPSAIYGHLNANGQVFLLNPNGIFFAKGAEINVGGILASTLGMSDQNFLSGNYHLNGPSTAGVTNDGSIKSAKAGYIALLAVHVTNNGSLMSPEGTALLGAGNGIDVSFANDGLLSYHINRGVLNAAVVNGGVIVANGGMVALTAEAKSALLESVVNNTGVIRAETVANRNGTISLLGGSSGTVQVAGTLDASAPHGGNGGQIETSGARVQIAPATVVTTKAAAGQNGNWLIDPNDFTIAASGGDETGAQLSTALVSGSVNIESSEGTTSGSGNINVDDNVSWSGSNALMLTAADNININATMTLGGNAGLMLNPATPNGSGVAVSSGTVNVMPGVGVVNFTGTGNTLQIGGTPYTIITTLGAQGSTTGTDLQGMNGNLSGHYALGSDIDASATSGWNSGSGFAPIGSPSTSFSGKFNGLGHTINDLTINRPTTEYVGLFGNNAGDISNVGLVDESVTGESVVGGLIGANAGPVTDSYVTGSVTGTSNAVGGLIGIGGGVISGDYASATVQGKVDVGGLIGSNSNAPSNTIISSYATGSVNGSNYVGGLVGKATQGTIADSYASGNVSGAFDVGGLIGRNGAAVSDSYASGSVSGPTAPVSTNNSNSGTNSGIGGLVGYNQGTIFDSYATGDVTGVTTSGSLGSIPEIDVGGFVGNNIGNISDAYSTGHVTPWTVPPSPPVFAGAFIGRNPNSNGVVDGYFDSTTAGVPLIVGSGSSNGISGLTTLQLASGLTAGLSSSAWANSDDQTTPYLVANEGFDRFSGVVFLGSDPSATPDKYNVIDTLDQLQAINTTGLTQNYVLGTNINASATSTWNNGAGFVPIGRIPGASTAFGGVFDGLGHIIANLNINRRYTNYVGLFGASFGTIRNVGVAGGIVIGDVIVGGLIGSNQGSVSDVFAESSVSGYSGIGGLIGQNQTTGLVNNAYAEGSVSGVTLGTIGGLISANNGEVSDIYAVESITGGNASHTGGLIGDNSSFLTNGYWDLTTSGQTSATGSASTGTVTGGGALTDAQMKTANSYTDWAGSIDSNGSAGKTDPWRIYDGHTMPLLTAFLKPLSVSADNTSVTYNGTDQTGPVTYTATGSYDPSLILGAVTAGNAKDAGTYTLSSAGLYSTQMGYDIVASDGSLTIKQKSLTVSGLTAENKFYDGTTLATLSGGTLNGVISGDTVDLTNDTTGTFASKNAGNGIAVTTDAELSGADAGNYSIVQPGDLTANIAQKGLTISGLTAEDKTYDGTTLATLNGGTLNGVISGDTVDLTNDSTGTFASKNAGNGIAVTTDAGLSGADADNYSLVQPGGLTANIAQKGLTISGLTAENKIYDGATAATLSSGTLNGVINGDTVTLTNDTSGVFASKDVGSGIAVTTDAELSGTDAGNYSLAQPGGITANITPKALTVSGIGADDKIYDGTTTVTLNGGTLNGVISGDTVTLTNDTSGVFASKNAGNSIAVTTDVGISGADAGNYSIAQPGGLTANITKKGLTVSGLTAENKTYDGTTDATLSNGTLNGVISGDTVTLTNDTSGVFASKDIGNDITVTTDAELSEADAGDYSIVQPGGLTANIAQKAVTISGLTAEDKAYDGNTTATLSGGTLNGIISGDTVDLTNDSTGVFASKDVGNDIAVTTDAELSGTDAGNYSLAQPGGITANIIPDVPSTPNPPGTPSVPNAPSTVQQTDAVGVAVSTLQRGQPGTVSGVSNLLDPHSTYMQTQGIKNPSPVKLSVSSGGSATGAGACSGESDLDPFKVNDKPMCVGSTRSGNKGQP